MKGGEEGNEKEGGFQTQKGSIYYLLSFPSLFLLKLKKDARQVSLRI